MKRNPGAAALAAVLLLSPRDAPGADLAELQARGSLRVLAVISNEETYFVAHTPRGGFDWELLAGFASLNKLKLELEPVPGWDGLIPALRAGRGDVIAGGFADTESRRAQVDFTAETFPTRSVVITRKPGRMVRTLEELKGERIGTLKGAFMYDDLLAAGIPAGKIDVSVPTGGIPEALKAGTITAGVDGIEAALTARIRDPELQIGLFLGRPASLAYAVRKQDAHLLKALNEYLGNVRRTPTWSRLVVKYFGTAAPEILKKARGE
jgi:ABC-type amino acid transport substrate-binding protein